jgi:predicted transcriptional regulator YheO
MGALLGEPPVSASGGHEASGDAARLIGVFTSLVDHLGRVLPANTEVILHDLSKMPNSIVAISGNLTGRQVGGPATDYLLSKIRSGDLGDEAGYVTELPDGRRLQSSTMIVWDSEGTPAAALCMNIDATALLELKLRVDDLLHASLTTPSSPSAPAPSERFPRSVDELTNHLMQQAIARVGVEPSEMKKEHKVAVVRALEEAGFFLVREGTETIARVLNVTKFTIYNYRNEIQESVQQPIEPDQV